MAYMKLGSKSEVFHLDGRTWFCSNGLQTDFMIQVEDMRFHLHKFPMISRSGFLENLLGNASMEYDNNCVLQLHDIPGGSKTFLMIAKFCYGVRIDVTATNVVSLRCAAEYLQMSEEYGEGNLISQTENFLDEVFANWNDSIKSLETCEEVLPFAEELHIVSRCISSLAMKASADLSLFSWPMSGSDGAVFWNGIRTTARPASMKDDWWFDDASFLKFPLYKRFIEAVYSRGMKPEKIAMSIIHYSKRNLPLLGSNRQSESESGNFMDIYSPHNVSPLHENQRNLLEELVELLPDGKNVTPTKFLLRLLRTSMVLHANPNCQENLERKIGAQLDNAALEDLLIPNMEYSAETLYDIDCVQRILDHFMSVDHDSSDPSSNYIVEESQLMGGSHPLTPVTMVANLMDGYLAEVASDINLKLSKFQALGGIIPEYARPLDDGIYRAIDIYLKAHPWMTDSEREQLCRLMNCQKLSLEACTHAAQNERLPLRVIVQVLFFEQLRLRTSIAGWLFVSDNINDLNNSSRNPSGNLYEGSNADVHGVNDMKERVYELEKECLNMKQAVDKLVKTKGGWNIFSKRFGFRSKAKTSPCNGGNKEEALINGENKGRVKG